ADREPPRGRRPRFSRRRKQQLALPVTVRLQPVDQLFRFPLVQARAPYPSLRVRFGLRLHLPEPVVLSGLAHDKPLSFRDGPPATRWVRAVALNFLGQHLSFFLPLYKKQWRNRGRLMASHMPLFPGYLFLHGDAQARMRALETNQVAQVLTVPDGAELR